ncbi:unnamed protein product [Paramecium sonneborni]|uniref:G domain-containing protein n=1 Tax=Paramecium sonneborni TaxID=65129 RepID=A0A8S1RLK2_9CILI|nr:unnamed protein product [Paramecium sonneborni]
MQQYWKEKSQSLSSQFLSDPFNFMNLINSIIQFKFDSGKWQLKQEISQILIRFKTRLQFWLEYFNYNSVSLSYEIKNLQKDRKNIPKPQVGVFFIGNTKSGKSTLMNTLYDPESMFINFNVDAMNFFTKKQDFQIGNNVLSCTYKIQSFVKNEIEYIDCPGFQDNLSEFNRSQYQLNLKLAMQQFKQVIVIFVLDSQCCSIENIKQTFSNLQFILKNKDILKKDQIHKLWTLLVLTKTEQQKRKMLIKNWNKLFEGSLDLNHKYFLEMLKDENQCLEFKSANKLQDEKCKEYLINFAQSIEDKIAQLVINQKHKKLNIEFSLNEKDPLFLRYIKFISVVMLQFKGYLRQLNKEVQFLLNYGGYINQKLNALQALLQILDQDEFQINQLKNLSKKLGQWCERFINSPSLQELHQEVSMNIDSALYFLEKLLQNQITKKESVNFGKYRLYIQEQIELVQQAINHETSRNKLQTILNISSLGIGAIFGGFLEVKSSNEYFKEFRNTAKKEENYFE